MNVGVKAGFYIENQLYELVVDINADKDYYIKLKELLTIKKSNDYELRRIGNKFYDGGYVMLDDFSGTKIAYSFGISDEVSWDKNMAKFGYDVYMYDPTIEKLPMENHKFHFFKEGLSAEDEEHKPYKSLKHFLEVNNHLDEKNMILKIDIEGMEWEFLNTVESDILKKFDQIIFEFHNIIKPQTINITKMLEKLNQTHDLVHLHGNNSSNLLKVGYSYIPDVFEATYVNKEKYKTEKDSSIYIPTDLDRPNDYGRADITLGYWNNPIEF